MKNFLLIVVALCLFGTAATYIRYKSFDPCVWIEQDLVRQSGLPKLVVQGQTRARFLAKGIADPTPYQCIKTWWGMRADGTLKPNGTRR
jgi:hypothetical protein